MNDAGPARLPAAARRAGIIEAADAEFAANGLAGTRLEAIAARAGISHPRIVQMFGSKRKLFLEVVHAAYDRIEAAFAGAEPKLAALGVAYVRLLQSDPTVGLVVLQGYAAAADEPVREAVRRRHLALIDRAGAARTARRHGLERVDPRPGRSGRPGRRLVTAPVTTFRALSSLRLTHRGAGFQHQCCRASGQKITGG